MKDIEHHMLHFLDHDEQRLSQFAGTPEKENL
jgi:hypothetical protein